MPDLRFSDAEGRSVEDILEIGRRFQNTDSIYRGATYDTAKLLCDTIEILNRTLETERRGYGAKLRSAFEGVMPIVRQYLRRKPICEIMVCFFHRIGMFERIHIFIYLKANSIFFIR